MSNAQRLILDEEVETLLVDRCRQRASGLSEAELNVAYHVMEEAFDIQQRERRKMTLEEAILVAQRYALAKVAEVSSYVEAIGV